jgi:kynurenine formamidase
MLRSCWILLLLSIHVPGVNAGGALIAGKGLVFHDLSHPIPLFAPLDGDSTISDLSAPVAGSRPIAGSGGLLGVRTPKPTMQLVHGNLSWGYVYYEEHYSTHVDSTDHFITTNPDLVTVDKPDARGVHEFSLDELIGPIVYIDISTRVAAELSKNDGAPSPDPSITNFDNDSGNNVTLEDIDAVAEYIVDGVYIVMNVGWEPFYEGPPRASNWAHPYNNLLNHPGITPDAVDRLIEIEERRGIRIGGLVADNIAIESGHSIRGPEMRPSALNVPDFHMYLHAIGLPRGWKLVENAAHLSLVAKYPQRACTLIVGAPKVAGASGIASRLIAMCPDQT